MSAEREAPAPMADPRALPRVGEVTRRILRGTLLVAVCTILVKAVGFVKEVVIASTFGRGDVLEAFLIALVLPTTLSAIVGGSFSQAFLPVYVRLRKDEGVPTADRLFADSLYAALGLLVVVGALLWWAAPWLVPLVASGYAPEKQALTLSMLRWLTPICLLATLPPMLAALLHADERFARVSLSQASVPGLTLVLVATMGAAYGARPLVVGALGGAVIETALLWSWVRRRHASSSSSRGSERSPAFPEVRRQWGLAAGAILFMNVTVLVDQAMAAHLSAGSVAALSYAYRLIALPLGLATLSIGTAVLPVLSDLAAEPGRRRFWHNLARWLRVGLWGSLLPTVVLAFAGVPLVSWIYQRGAFGADDAAVVGSVLAAYAGMIPFYVAGIIGVRALGILRANEVVFATGVINLITNVIGNVVLSRFFGVAGIALSTVCVYLISAAIILATLARRRARTPSTEPASPAR